MHVFLLLGTGNIKNAADAGVPIFRHGCTLKVPGVLGDVGVHIFKEQANFQSAGGAGFLFLGTGEF